MSVWMRFVRDSKDEYGQVHYMRFWMRCVRDSTDSMDKYIV